jgi:hypothetical protein
VPSLFAMDCEIGFNQRICLENLVMHLGLTTLISNILKWPREGQKKHRPARLGRKLVAEQLETRYALTGDLETSLAPLLPPDGGGSPPPADISTPPASPTDPILTPPTTPPVLPPIIPPPPGTGNTPPIIVEFDFTSDGDWIHFQGLVTDDQDPTGYLVHIWGFASFNITVAADDHFSFSIAVTSELNGTISAQTADVYGLLSNTFTLTL